MNPTRLLLAVILAVFAGAGAHAQCGVTPLALGSSDLTPTLDCQGDLEWSVPAQRGTRGGLLLSTRLRDQGLAIGSGQLWIGGAGERIHIDSARARRGSLAGSLDLSSTPSAIAAADTLYAQVFVRRSGGFLDFSEVLRIDLGAPELELQEARVKGRSWVRDVRLSRPANVTVELPYSLRPEDVGDLRIVSPQPLVLAAGTTQARLRVQALNPAGRTKLQTLQLNLGAPSGAILVNGGQGAPDVPVGSVPSAEFTIESQSQAEGAGVLDIQVQLSALASSVVRVPFVISGTANGDDFQLVSPNPLRIPLGSQSGAIQVDLADDLLDELDETLVITLQAPTGATLGAGTVHTLTLIDDDAAPSVEFDLASDSQSEEVGGLAVGLSLSAPSSFDISVPFTIGGSAGASDFSVLTLNPLTIPAGATTAQIDLDLTGDLLDEADETVVLTLQAPTNATLGAGTTHTLTLVDDDEAPSIEFALAADSQSEELGALAVALSLSAPSGLGITLPFTLGGDADAGDVTLLSASPLLIPAGATAAQIDLDLIGDLLDENDEAALLTLQAPTNATLGAGTTHTLTLVDDDEAPSIEFTLAADSQSEELGALAVALSLSAPSGLDITLPFTLGGDADAGDVTLLSASPLLIPAGATAAQIDLDLIGDLLDENDETALLTLQAPTNATLGAGTTHTLTLVDDDVAPTVEFALTESSAGEGAGSTDIEVVLSTASSLDISVPFSYFGTAMEPDDYQVVTPSPLVFPAGATSALVTVTLVDDAESEVEEDVLFSLGSPVNATLGAVTDHALYLIDNEGNACSDDFNNFNLNTAKWELLNPLGDVQLSFDGTGTQDARVRLFIPEGVDHRAWDAMTAPRISQLIPDEDIQVVFKMESSMDTPFQQQGILFEQSDATFVRFDYFHDGVSYNLFAGTVIGANRTAEASFSVPVIGDHWMRVTRTGDSWNQEWSLDGINWAQGGSFSFPLSVQRMSLFVANSVVNTTPPAHTAIFDFIEISTDPILNEDGGTVTDTTPPLIYDVNSSVTETSLTIDWHTDELASGELRYGLTPSFELGSVMQPGVALFQSIQIPDLTPGTDYYVQIVATDGLANSSFGDTLLLTTDAPVVPVVNWTTSAQSLAEDAGSSTVRAQLDVLTGVDVTVPFLVSGDATEGVDYTINPNPVVIPAGQLFADVIITVTDDAITEPSETALLTIDSPVNATVGVPAQHEIMLLDNDGPPLVAFVNAASTASEGAGNLTVTVELSKVADTAVSIPYTLGGTATDGVDYTLTPASPLVIPQGLLTADFAITLIDDILEDGTEDLTLTLGTPTGADLGATAVHTLTIFDNDGVLPFRSDDFNAFNLDRNRWELFDNSNDGRLRMLDQNTADASLEIRLPAGIEHSAFTPTLTAPRVLQDVPDQDFSVVTRINSVFDSAFQDQGFIFEQDEDSYIRFDTYFNGSVQRVFAARIINGNADIEFNDNIAAPTNGIWLRMTRTGDDWVMEYSFDGTAYTFAGSFTQPLNLQRAGVYAANSNPNPVNIPAFNARFDYIEFAGDPLINEDGGTAVDVDGPYIHGVTDIAGRQTLQVEWATDELATGALMWGLTPALEMGAIPAPALAYEQRVALIDLDPDQMVYVQIEATDAGNRTSTGDVMTFTTRSLADTSPLIDVWYGMQQQFGNVGQTQRWANVLGNASTGSGNLFLEMSLNDGPWELLSLGANERRLQMPGDYVVEIDFDDLLNGDNEVRLRATDGTDFSNITEEVVRLTFTAGTVWPDNFVVDWSALNRIDDAAQVVDGKWAIQGDKLRMIETGYDRLVAIGDEITWDDYEVTCTIVMHSIDPVYTFPANPGPSVGFLLRWQGHTQSGGQPQQPNQGFRPLGTITCVQWYEDGTQRLELQDDFTVDFDNSGQTFAFEVPYIFKARVETAGPGMGTYSFKVWEEGTAEPANWAVSATMDDDLDTGSLLLLLHYADASYGNVTVTPI